MQIFIKIFTVFFITMNMQMLYAEERLIFGADIKNQPFLSVKHLTINSNHKNGKYLDKYLH